MSEAPAYTAPPIIEAVIQLNFQDTLSTTTLKKLIKVIKKGYDSQSPSIAITAKIEFQTQEVNFDQAPQAKLSSADEADSVLVQPDALAWSRLAPYEGWDAFVGRVCRDLNLAHKVVGHRKLTRIGVRYVNRIDVPYIEGVARYEDYLAINIELPDCFPSIQNYGWRFEREYDEGDLLAIVQSAVVEPEIPDTGAFVLDIDVVARANLPAKLDDIFIRLSHMRNLKNELFELAIRDKAREKFSK